MVGNHHVNAYLPMLIIVCESMKDHIRGELRDSMTLFQEKLES